VSKVQGPTNAELVDQTDAEYSDNAQVEIEDSRPASSLAPKSGVRPTQTQDAGANFNEMARDDDAQDQFAQALVGQNYSELSVREQQIIGQLIADIQAGKIQVEFDDEGGNIALEDGVDGAFIPGNDGEPGTIVIAAGFDPRRTQSRDT
jgi:hypothetical protein